MRSRNSVIVILAAVMACSLTPSLGLCQASEPSGQDSPAGAEPYLTLMGSGGSHLAPSGVMEESTQSGRLIAYERPLYQVLSLDKPDGPRGGTPQTFGQILQQMGRST